MLYSLVYSALKLAQRSRGSGIILVRSQVGPVFAGFRTVVDRDKLGALEQLKVFRHRFRVNLRVPLQAGNWRRIIKSARICFFNVITSSSNNCALYLFSISLTPSFVNGIIDNSGEEHALVVDMCARGKKEAQNSQKSVELGHVPEDVNWP